MKIKKKLLKKYNTPETLLVVSSFPKKQETYSQDVCAVASFTKNTLAAIKEKSIYKKIVVLTMITHKKEVYEEDNILIIRCFSRNNIFSYIRLFSFAKLFTKNKEIMVEFEFSSFGDTIPTALLSCFIWGLFLLRKRVTLVIHQVVLDISPLWGHIGISSKSPLIPVFNFLLRLYYMCIAFPACSIVVLEDALKKRLSIRINANKIYLIPHGVDTEMSIRKGTKHESRVMLGMKNDEIIILCFGYVTWYKGIDFLVSSFKNITDIAGKKVKLVIAGGPSFTQQNKAHYQKYYNTVKKQVEDAPHITLTGFVDEKKISLYFNACDLVLFPYRTFMSSSGPLATALSFDKPFLIAKQMEEMLTSQDIQDSLQKTGLRREDVLFRLTKKSLTTLLNKSFEKTRYEKLRMLSMLLKKKRSFKNLAILYKSVLSKQTIQEGFLQKLSYYITTRLLALPAQLFLGKGVDKKFPFLVTLYKKVYSVVTKDKQATVNIPLGLKLTVSTKDAGLGMFLRTKGAFEPLQTRSFLDAIKPGFTVFDIGANVGYYTLLASKKVGKAGKVYAFEPDSRSLRLLHMNVRANKCDNVTLVKAAVGNKDATGMLTLADGNPGESSLSKKMNGRKIQVKMITLDNFVREKRINNVDILKMDIEGAEVEALTGGQKTLEKAKHAKFFIECNQQALSQFSYSPQHLINKLRTLGFRPQSIIDEFNKTISSFSKNTLKKTLRDVTFVGIVAKKNS